MAINDSTEATCGSRTVYEFGVLNGWFDKVFAKEPRGRTLTWRTALSLYLQLGGAVMVETGCQRQPQDWGAGCSTYLLSRTLSEFGAGHLHSVDNSAGHLEVARTVVRDAGIEPVVTFHLSDSVKFLEEFDQAIDFLYLDSFDFEFSSSGALLCQEHQWCELKAAMPKMSARALVLLDDNELPEGGKTKLAKGLLEKEKWLCLLDWKQSLWLRL